jgi:hypothetical protein
MAQDNENQQENQIICTTNAEDSDVPSNSGFLIHGLDIELGDTANSGFLSMFAFTSMGGQINTTLNDGRAPPMFVMNGENYHQIGSLLAFPGNSPKFTVRVHIFHVPKRILFS